MTKKLICTFLPFRYFPPAKNETIKDTLHATDKYFCEQAYKHEFIGAENMIRLAEEKDYLQLATMKWQHSQEDDEDYGEGNLEGVVKQEFINSFVDFMKIQKSYTVFVVEENEVVISSMFVSIIPKVPKPNGKSKSIAYLTNVYTLKEYRNSGIGTKLLQYIKNYLKECACELVIVWPSANSAEWYKKNGFCSENEVFECPL
ncbi:MAG: GNAT family N-acetyltransferase [Subdoligranulum sp.]|nr:GNAT family N-acetyltransferase [Subdoligranulum sp.]